VLLPLTPGQHQYSITTLPGGPLTVNLSISYTPLQAIEYLTSNLSWLLQQPQGATCGTLPGYFAVSNSNEYIIQPIAINETTTVEALTIFGSGASNLVSGEVMISSSEVPALKPKVSVERRLRGALVVRPSLVGDANKRRAQSYT